MATLIRYTAKRLLFAIPVLLTVVAVTFVFSHVVPADPARVYAGLHASQQEVDQIKAQYGLNRPLPVQFWHYVTGILRGDFGSSLWNGQPVAENIRHFLPNTALLTATSTVLAVAVAVPLGVAAAVRPGRIADQVGRLASLTGVAVPVFWAGILLLLVFYSRFHVLPSSGVVSGNYIGSQGAPSVTGVALIDSALAGNWGEMSDSVAHLVLPSITLGLPAFARITRVTRASMVDAMRSPFVAVSRAHGIPEWRIIWLHALRNACGPILTIVGLTIGYTLGGSVLVELVFQWPGIGLYAYNSITALDYNGILGVTLVATLIFVVVNLLTDVVQAWIDPRIQIPGRS